MNVRKVNERATSWLLVPWVVVAVLGGWFTTRALERESPYKVLSWEEPIIGTIGGYSKIVLFVQFDSTRDCSLRVNRHLIDSEGTVHDLGDSAASAETLRAVNNREPGVRRISVPIPQAAVPGAASLVTSREYRCNPAHEWMPIRYTTVFPMQLVRPVP